jgi:hypothetical protein
MLFTGSADLCYNILLEHVSTVFPALAHDSSPPIGPILHSTVRVVEVVYPAGVITTLYV